MFLGILGLVLICLLRARVEVQKSTDASVPSGDGSLNPVVPKGNLAVVVERQHKVTESSEGPEGVEHSAHCYSWTKKTIK